MIDVIKRLRLYSKYILYKIGLYGVLDRCRDLVNLTKITRGQSVSQFGEDLFLQEYFGDRQGLYIEVGGNEPFNLSNTYMLYRRGWSGLVIEPILRLYNKHQRFRPRDIQINAVASEKTGMLTFYEMIPFGLSTCDQHELECMLSAGSAYLLREYSVPSMTVADLYRKYLAPRPVMLLTIDTEGHDMSVLRGVDWNEMHPEIIICEANDKSHKIELCQYLADYQYKCIKTLGCNLIFSIHNGEGDPITTH